MKINISVLLAVVVLASCSTPKYSYYFDQQNHNSGKKQAVAAKEMSVLAVDPQMLVASTTTQPIVLTEKPVASNVNPEVKKTYLQMNSSERKAVRHQIKKDIKTYVASKKKSDSAQATQAGMDNDLKLAIIFGAIGIVSFLIGGSVFQVIGGIALIIGVVFFVKWIIRQ